MGLTAAGTTIAISAGVPASQTLIGYSALTYTEIGGVEKLGPIGAVTNKVEFQPLKGAKEKHKGSTDFGALQPVLAHDKVDAGQILLRAAAEPDENGLYSFVVTFSTGDKRYFRGRAFGYPETIDGADTLITAAPAIEICTAVVKDDSGGHLALPLNYLGISALGAIGIMGFGTIGIGA